MMSLAAILRQGHALSVPPPSSAAARLHSLIVRNRAPPNTPLTNIVTYESSRSAIPLAGVYDALSAKIFTQASAPALFVSGFGVSASRLGRPDAGILTLSEMEDAARSICSIVEETSYHGGHGGRRVPPVIVDGDTGYGGAANVRRTIHGLAAAGAAAITVEDQVFPKRCTVAAGKGVRVVSTDAAVNRIRTAIAARDEWRSMHPGQDVWIVARTDCRAALGLEEAVRRCEMFEELGADVVYAENLGGVEEYGELRRRLDRGTVTVLAQVQQRVQHRRVGDGGDTGGAESVPPLLSIEEIGALGYDLALFGVSPLQTVVGALQNAAAEFLSNGGIIGKSSSGVSMADFSDVKRVVGFPELDDFESRFPCE